MTAVMKFFEYESAAKFAPEWRKLSEADKKHLKDGIADGSLTY